MVPQKFWKVVRVFCLQSVWKPVRWWRGLHVASIQNGVLPHSICKYHLIFLCFQLSEDFPAPQVLSEILQKLGFIFNFGRETHTRLTQDVLFLVKCLNVSSSSLWIQHTKCKSLLYDQKHEIETQDFSRVSEQYGQEKKGYYYLQIWLTSHLIYKLEYM